MSLLYELRYFLTFAQFSGFFPYTFDVDHRNRKIEKVTLKKTRPVFAWFAFVFSIQLLYLCLTGYCAFVFMTERQVYLNDLPFAVSAMTAWSVVTWYIALFAARLMALRSKRIERAIHLANKLEAFIGEAGMGASSPNSIKMRTVVAVTIVVASVISFLI